MKRVYTISSDAAFLDTLAGSLWAESGEDGFKLSQALILLPTRRSCRHLREAFLRQTKGKPTLLPRMHPLGDLDEDELYFSTDADVLLDIPPAIAPLRRQLLLTQLVLKRDDTMPLDQAAQLAQALGSLLDQVQIERCDFGRLNDLVVTKDLAVHWQQTVQFLDILTKLWPQVLAEEGCIDIAERRNRVLEAQVSSWRNNPPPYHIIAAGSTGTMPATSDLLDVIAGLSLGAVILPGLDQSLDEEAWQAITETHPQFGMKVLLEKFSIKRGDVKVWGSVKNPRAARVRLLNESMRPAEVTEAWQHVKPAEIPSDATQGLTSINLDHPNEEAQTIALLMRETLEKSNKTVALVTLDRALAERVSALLARWGVAANDSAGTSLANQPIGAFLTDVLAASSPNATSVEILSLLKHPFAACGLNPAECRSTARQIEKIVWRTERPEHSDWLDTFKQMLQPLRASWNKSLPLHERIKTHIDLSEKLAASDTEKGPDRLWRGEAGETASEWLDDWRNAAGGFPTLTGGEYFDLFIGLLRSTQIRPSWGQHPRLSILGPLEARLIQTDLMILGGLNENNWPPEIDVDPWMSRPMKADFGLPLPERRIGLSAHDFVQLASAPEVVLTRSNRSGNAPTVPSRFLLQLETVLRALKYSNDTKDALAPTQPWVKYARLLDEPAIVQSCVAPEPRPPINTRPARLAVTEIGPWRRNPYAIYAKHILKLRKLEPLEAEIDASDRGTLIHAALDAFIKAHPKTLPLDALDQLLQTGKKIFTAYDKHPEVKAFWWPRFERIASWFIVHEQERRSEGVTVVKAEAKGRMNIGAFMLDGRADRIDKLPDGSLAIVDYKTGSVPAQKDIKAGYEPQLPLLACIAAAGGFDDIPAAFASQLSYWKLNGGREIARESGTGAPVEDLAKTAREGLEALIKAFADPTTPYQAVPKPQQQPRFDDYAHLARLAEWGRTGGDE